MAGKTNPLDEKIRKREAVGKCEVGKGRGRLGRIMAVFGPGMITGVSDDDPSGIATYSQAGAQFGYAQLWTLLLTYPLMTAVQEACARIGAVTGKGIAAAIREHYGRPVLYASVWLVIIANTINIGADIGAMAEAANLILPMPFAVVTLVFAAVILILEIFTSYAFYSRILKWMTLFMLAYPATLLVVNAPWSDILAATIRPTVEPGFDFLYLITGVLGTTISPYMFFWEASEEVEEEIEMGCIDEEGRPRVSREFIRSVRVDNAAGMLASQLTGWCIMAVAATVLHQGGTTDVATAADAARALEPLVGGSAYAGYLAKTLFALGIIGLGFMAVPVLAGSASYGLSEALDWNKGLSLKLRQAHGFYGVITIAMLGGLSINFIGIDPMKALIFSAVINGVAAVPLLYLILRISRDRRIMGGYRSGPLSMALIWATFLGMAAAAAAMLVSLILR